MSIENNENNLTDTNSEVTENEVKVETNETSETKEIIDKVEAKVAASTDEDNSGNKKTVYIIEGVIAAIAVVFIVVALVLSNKKNNVPDMVATSQDSVSDNQEVVVDPLSGETVAVDIDNSALFTDVPQVPSADSFNTMTEEECEKLVASNDMIKIEAADGTYAYVANYNDNKALAEAIAYTDEEVQDFLYKNLLMNYIVPLEEERDTAQLYDNVNIDYAGYLGEEQFEGGTASGQIANLGSGSYIPGFEEGIVGMKVGETKDVKVTFPENYRAENLAGKDVTFKITLNEICGQPAELTDELVSTQITGFLSKDDVVNAAQQQIINDKAFAYLNENFYVSKINNDIATNYYNNTMDLYDTMCQQYQMSVEDMLLTTGTTLPDFKKEVMDSCAESALSITMYYIIAEDLGLSVSDTDIQDMCSKYGYTSTEEFYASYGEQTVKDAILTDKVTLKLIELADSEEDK